MSDAYSLEVRQLIDQNMASGLYSTDDDVLIAALHVLSDYNATIADIRQGQIDFQRGLGQPMPDTFNDLRTQLGSHS